MRRSGGVLKCPGGGRSREVIYLNEIKFDMVGYTAIALFRTVYYICKCSSTVFRCITVVMQCLLTTMFYVLFENYGLFQFL